MVILGLFCISKCQTFFLTEHMMVHIPTASFKWSISKCFTGKVCFMIDNFNTNRDIIKNGTGKLECLKYDPTIMFNPSHWQCFVEHISTHILHDKSIDHSLEPCGLCLSLALLCKFTLTNGKGHSRKVAININASSCLNLIKLLISVVAKCSDALPCTNHPMNCHYCPHSSPAVWSYNFCQHLLQHHPAVSLKKHESIFTLSKLEKDGMKRIWDQWHEQWKAHSKTEHCLVISETHQSAHLVLKCVFFIPLRFLYSPTKWYWYKWYIVVR